MEVKLRISRSHNLILRKRHQLRSQQISKRSSKLRTNLKSKIQLKN